MKATSYLIQQKKSVLICQRSKKMQPTYVYPTEFDQEVQWRSKFSIAIPIFIGFLQFITTLAIVGLEIASVVISPVYGTLYAGFWCSVIFTLSWISMFVLGTIDSIILVRAMGFILILIFSLLPSCKKLRNNCLRNLSILCCRSHHIDRSRCSIYWKHY